MKTFQGIIVDVTGRRQFKGEIVVVNGKVLRVEEKEHDNGQYILPGLVDAHVQDAHVVMAEVPGHDLQGQRLRKAETPHVDLVRTERRLDKQDLHGATPLSSGNAG